MKSHSEGLKTLNINNLIDHVQLCVLTHSISQASSNGFYFVHCMYIPLQISVSNNISWLSFQFEMKIPAFAACWHLFIVN